MAGAFFYLAYDSYQAGRKEAAIAELVLAGAFVVLGILETREQLAPAMIPPTGETSSV